MKGKKHNGDRHGSSVKDRATKDVYEGKGSPVLKEARAKRACGGRSDPGKVDGPSTMKSYSRPGRKRGGAVGAEMSPLSTAARGSGRSPDGSLT